MKTLNLVTFILVFLGAINWAIYGLMGTDIVVSVFGSVTVLTKLTYLLVGLSGLYMLSHFKSITHS